MATATSKFLEGDSVAHFPLGGVAMGRGSERLAAVFQCISTVAAALAVILTEEQEGGPACCWWIWKPMGRTLRLQDSLMCPSACSVPLGFVKYRQTKKSALLLFPS